MKVFVFDLDGTLFDSFSPYFSFLEKRLNTSLSSEQKQEAVAINPRIIVERYVESSKVNQIIEELQLMGVEAAQQVKLFPSVKQMLELLKAQNKLLAVFTSRDLASTLATLEAGNCSHFFDMVVSGDCVQERKPDPEGLRQIQSRFDCQKKDLVMIGDHDVDMRAAESFGALKVRASWHRHWPHETCQIADHQFHCDLKFTNWLKTLPEMAP